MIYFVSNTINESKTLKNIKLKFTFNVYNKEYGLFSIPSEYSTDKIVNSMLCKRVNAYFLRPTVTKNMYNILRKKNFEKDMPEIKDFSIIDPLISPTFDLYNLISKFYLKNEKLSHRLLTEEILFTNDKILLYDLNDLMKDEVGCTTPWIEEANRKLAYSNSILKSKEKIIVV